MWAVQVTPLAFALHGVSCAATACTAVGRSLYRNGGYPVSGKPPDQRLDLCWSWRAVLDGDRDVVSDCR
jgi:hypothetical protein